MDGEGTDVHVIFPTLGMMGFANAVGEAYIVNDREARFKMTQQASDWLQERTGRITASEVHKIMGRGRAKDKYFSEQGETYLRCKIGELLTGEIENGGRVNPLAMEWGASHEHEAIARFEKETGRAVQEYFGVTNPKFFALDLFSGGRLKLGFATGWNAIEYQALGMSFADRGKRLDQGRVLGL